MLRTVRLVCMFMWAFMDVLFVEPLYAQNKDYPELPEIRGRESFRTIMMDDSGKRNYSVNFDAVNRIPKWVAYPLNRKVTGPGKAPAYKWYSDQKVPIWWQPDLSRGYQGRWKAAHLIPPEDRMSDKDAWEQTFLSMTAVPMLSSFEERIWHPWEELVRSWALKSDILYVVSGAVPGDEKIKDSKGNRVTVPQGFYKAVLRKSGKRWSACAIYILHNPVTRATSAVKVLRMNSIPLIYLEEIVGYELFPSMEREMSRSEWLNLKQSRPYDEPWWWQ